MMTFLGYEWYNDLDQLPYYGLGFLAYISILIMAIVFHEIGHRLYFKFNDIGAESKWIFFKEGTWIANHLNADITEHQHNVALWFGFIGGLLPIICASIIFPPIILMILPYGWVIRYDIKEIFSKIEFEEGV